MYQKPPTLLSSKGCPAHFTLDVQPLDREST
jgi:hypothetical protein